MSDPLVPTATCGPSTDRVEAVALSGYLHSKAPSMSHCLRLGVIVSKSYGFRLQGCMVQGLGLRFKDYTVYFTEKISA